MKITRENYEMYFLDFIEGNLAPGLVEELSVFLTLHPDLAEEMEGIEGAAALPEREVYDFKDALKKPELPVSAAELERLLIAEAEGDATPEETRLINDLCERFPEVSGQRRMFAGLKLTAPEIRFEDKSGIYFNDEIDFADTTMRLIALIEGDLDPEQAAAVHSLIEKDPRLKKEFDLLSYTHLPAVDTPFTHRADLLIPSSVNMDDVQNLLIAKVEGDLSFTQSEKLNAMLAADKDLHSELGIFYKTRIPAPVVLFEDKGSLYRRNNVIVMRRFSIATAAAASVAAIIWIASLFQVAPASMAGSHDPSAPWQPSSAPAVTEGPAPVTPEKASEFVRPPVDHLAESVVVQRDSLPRMKAPPMMQLITPEEEAFALEFDRGIIPVTPDMSHIYNEPAQQTTAGLETEPATIWQLLGDVAEKKLEKTAAYALVERQAEKVSTLDDSQFSIRRVEKGDETELRMKLGKFELNTGLRHKVDKPFFLRRLYDRITR